jgi:hypothetical protein
MDSMGSIGVKAEAFEHAFIQGSRLFTVVW